MSRKDKKYALTPEHRAQLKPWADKWIANTMSTKPMDAEEKRICTEAAYALYNAANLPRPKAVVFVSSPFVLKFASGFASFLLAKRKIPATAAATYATTRDAIIAATAAATYDATSAATYATTRDATAAATYDATYATTRDAIIAATAAATDAATAAATLDATRDATAAATYDATSAATYATTRDAIIAATAAATYDATRNATRDATRDAIIAATIAEPSGEDWFSCPHFARIAYSLFGVDFLSALERVKTVESMWQGGNQWSGFESCLSFFKDVVKLDLPVYEKYAPWLILAEHSGPRVMHADFCMISDRPEILKVDNRNRPHCATGPFCQWRDGSKLYALHGVRVPAKYIERPVIAAELFKEANAQVRMAVIRKEGYGKFIKELNGKLISEAPSTRGSTKPVQLWEVDVPALGVVRLLKLTWHDTKDEQETFIAVPTTEEEFGEMFGLVPTDPDNAELVRLATMQINTATHEIVFES